MDNAIEDGIGEGGVLNLLMPLIDISQVEGGEAVGEAAVTMKFRDITEKDKNFVAGS